MPRIYLTGIRAIQKTAFSGFVTGGDNGFARRLPRTYDANFINPNFSSFSFGSGGKPAAHPVTTAIQKLYESERINPNALTRNFVGANFRAPAYESIFARGAARTVVRLGLKNWLCRHKAIVVTVDGNPRGNCLSKEAVTAVCKRSEPLTWPRHQRSQSTATDPILFANQPMLNSRNHPVYSIYHATG